MFCTISSGTLLIESVTGISLSSIIYHLSVMIIMIELINAD